MEPWGKVEGGKHMHLLEGVVGVISNGGQAASEKACLYPHTRGDTPKGELGKWRQYERGESRYKKKKTPILLIIDDPYIIFIVFISSL